MASTTRLRIARTLRLFTAAPLMHPPSKRQATTASDSADKLLTFRDLLAGSTGLEPAASGVTGRRQRQHIAADPGKSGSAVPHLGHPMPIVDPSVGTACKFLQAPARSGVNGLDQMTLFRGLNRGLATNSNCSFAGPRRDASLARVNRPRCTRD